MPHTPFADDLITIFETTLLSGTSILLNFAMQSRPLCSQLPFRSQSVLS